ncbi:MAG TPA: SDR family NAD(P)-dependent oxidoreductase [Opitutaceae bacterium]|nr:SDR family NAD(P)-dependent oxidoreductase [Opitutaceae bacterium]
MSNSLQSPRLSVSHGESVRHPEQFASLGQALVNAAKCFPSHEVICVQADGQEIRLTYPVLLEQAKQILGGLRQAGLKAGAHVLFQLEHNQDFIPAFWACVLGGIIPVPLGLPPAYTAENATVAKLRNAWRLLDHPPILAADSNAPDLQSLVSADKSFRILTVNTLRRHPADATFHPSQLDDLALLLLTSGSTGTPKAVQLTHRNILGRSAATAQMNAFNEHDISLNWMPLDHVGGLVMFHVHDVCIGCRQLQLRPDYILSDPLRWLDWMHNYKVSITWAPNFAFGLVNDQLEDQNPRRWQLGSLRFILNGGEAIVSKTARRFIELLVPHGLPPTAMRPAWGMSETSSGVTFSDRFTLDRTTDADPFVEVGLPVPGVSIRIVDRSDAPVPEGKIGSLQVRGITVTNGYYNHPTLNQETFTSDGWFKTGDLGVLRDGRLTLTGREKDVIIINGANYHSHEIEAVVEGVDGVETSFTAVCGVRLPARDTDQLAIFYCPHPSHRGDLPALERAIRQAVISHIGANPDTILALEKTQIPKTAIGKIQRSQLRQAFENGLLKSEITIPSQPSWFWRRSWTLEPIDASPATSNSVQWILVNRDQSDAAVKLASLQPGRRSHIVSHGSSFAIGATFSHTAELNTARDYKRLVAELIARDGYPENIALFWTASEASLAESGIGGPLAELSSILYFAQALGEHEQTGTKCSLRVFTTRSQAVRQSDVIQAERAALTGFLRSLPEEMPWLSASIVDLPNADLNAQLRSIALELAQPCRAREVAFRGGERLVVRLESVSDAGGSSPLPLKKGGFYCVTGGLGGIGCELVRYLCGEQQARVLVLGRTAWARLRPEQQAFVAELQDIARGVEYASVDVGDAAAVDNAIRAATTTAKAELDGVFHLAGVYRPGALHDEGQASLLSAFSPKLAGAENLARHLDGNPDALFVAFSSVLGYFGGYLHSGYAAANSALDGFVHELRRRGRKNSFSLGWSTWADRGMNRGLGNADATRAKGYLEIDLESGLQSLLSTLRGADAHVLIGLDHAHLRIRQESGGIASSETVGARIAPRSETERQLARIWAEVLKRADVGVTDNFFEIGGKSLHAARIFARMEKQWGKALPLATLFKAPTIAALAAQLEAAGQPADSICRIDVLQPNGSLPPLFCVPGGASDAIVFRDLAAELGSERPFYALQAAGLDATGMDTELVEISGIAQAFLTQIKKIQPHGPYHLAGHCFGGLLVYEVAQILRSQGEKVGFLGLIDSVVGATLPTEMRITRAEKLAHHWAQMRGRSVYSKFHYVWSRLVGYREAKESRRRLHESFARIGELHRRYKVRPYAGSLTLLMARDSFFTSRPARDPRLFWKAKAEGGADVRLVAGDHASMLQKPYVRDLAVHLNTCLTEGSARGSE